jgi:hypothetical protein
MKKTAFFLTLGILAAGSVIAQTNSDMINNAIASGNCAILYEYIQRDKNETVPGLVSSAATALRRYTSSDAAAAKYRTDKMDPKIRRVPKEPAEGVFTDPEKYLPAVVSFLVNGVSDRFSRVKILHDWICDNIAYDTQMYFNDRWITDQDFVSVLIKKKAVCSGYSSLFIKMCQLAGIESIRIQGYSKGFGYSGTIGNRPDHEWNAVSISGKWYLVDVTWDAGCIDTRTYIKKYSTEYLFLDPRPFLYSHLPEKDQFQYFAPVLTAADFTREAFIPGVFFKYGLSLPAEKPGYNNTTAGDFSFDISMKTAGVSVSSQLATQSQRNIDSSSWEERRASVVSLKFDVPDANNYQGHVFARFNNAERIWERIEVNTFERDWLPRAEALLNDRKISEKELEYFRASYYEVEENRYYYYYEDQFDTPRNNAVLKILKLLEVPTSVYESVLSFNLRAAPGYSGYGAGILKYPAAYITYNQVSNTLLLAPLTGTLKAGSEQTFILSSKDFSNFTILIDGKMNNFAKNPGTGNFELTFTVPGDQKELIISGVTVSGNRYTAMGLVQYNVVQ